METYSNELQIHASSAYVTQVRLQQAIAIQAKHQVDSSDGEDSKNASDEICVQKRGLIHVKGKGDMMTYWIVSKSSFSKSSSRAGGDSDGLDDSVRISGSGMSEGRQLERVSLERSGSEGNLGGTGRRRRERARAAPPPAGAAPPPAYGLQRGPKRQGGGGEGANGGENGSDFGTVRDLQCEIQEEEEEEEEEFHNDKLLTRGPRAHKEFIRQESES